MKSFQPIIRNQHYAGGRKTLIPEIPVLFLVIGLLLASCAGAAEPAATDLQDPTLGEFARPIESLEPVRLDSGRPLRVVATTTLVADIAGRVGGESIEIVTLLPYGADPHGYSATPQDVRSAIEADVIVSNGFDLEGSLLADLAEAAADTPIVSMSAGIDALELASEQETDHAEAEGDEDHDEDHSGQDPHVWFDPLRVDYWAANAARTFIRLDPANEATYQSNAADLRQDLVELHSWIYQRTQSVPDENRELVTDHVALTYFAERYGFEAIGAVIPAYSSMAEASAQELSALQQLIEEREVAALFVSASSNPELSRQLANDVGIPVVRLYAGSLTPPGGEAPDYFSFMRYNVGAIVEALTP